MSLQSSIEGLGMLPKLVVCLLLVHTATAFVRVRRTDVQKLQHGKVFPEDSRFVCEQLLTI